MHSARAGLGWALRVTAYVVARRTAEIGSFRMALGASRERVVKGILREAMIQTAIGLAVGVPIALLCVLLREGRSSSNVGGYDRSVLIGVAAGAG